MAYQNMDKKRGAPINRTPAPDELTEIRHPRGGQSYGQNAPQPSSVAPGKAVQSDLAANLRDSGADSGDVLSQVIEKGVSGRGDNIPADGDNGQTRAVSAESYPPSHSMKRQQANYADIGKASLPAKSGAGAAPDPKEPN